MKGKNLESFLHLILLVKKKNDLCLPSNQLYLVKENHIYDYSRFIKYWNDETFVYFVKISKNGYFDDIDNDGYLEFAIYPMVAGNNPVTDAYIFSIVGKELKRFGMGKFHYEWGPNVKNILKDKWIKQSL